MEIKKIEVEPNQFIWVDLKAKIKEGDKVCLNPSFNGIWSRGSSFR